MEGLKNKKFDFKKYSGFTINKSEYENYTFLTDYDDVKKLVNDDEILKFSNQSLNGHCVDDLCCLLCKKWPLNNDLPRFYGVLYTDPEDNKIIFHHFDWLNRHIRNKDISEFNYCVKYLKWLPIKEDLDDCGPSSPKYDEKFHYYVYAFVK